MVGVQRIFCEGVYVCVCVCVCTRYETEGERERELKSELSILLTSHNE